MKIENVKVSNNLKVDVKKIVGSESSKSFKIKQLFELGLDVKEISTILSIRYNFAYNVISNHIVTNDIKVIKEQKESKKDLVISLFLEGKTNIEISKQLKTNYNYVYKILKDYKVSKEAKAQ